MSTKAQAWSLDFVIGIVITTLLVVYLLSFSGRFINLKSESLHDIQSDAQSISDYLVGKGFPDNWNKDDCIFVGITDGEKRIDKAKVEELHEFASSDYSTLKNRLSTKNDFLILFLDKEESPIEISGISEIGKPGITRENIQSSQNTKNLAKITRFLIYDSKIILMVVYVW